MPAQIRQKQIKQITGIMKIIMRKSIIAISLLAIICCGCKEHDRNENMTLRGKAISDVWFNATNA